MSAVKVPVRWSTVKPSPDSVRARAERVAAQHGGTVAAVSHLKVGKDRRGSNVWDAVITVEVPS